ncbi:MAG: hypothetical protein ACOY30_00890 [Bacillota bacterium]
MGVKVNEPYMVDDLVVYFVSEKEALVIDYDCRWELKTTPENCDCCTFRFRSYRSPGFQCRHIKAVRRLLG